MAKVYHPMSKKYKDAKVPDDQFMGPSFSKPGDFFTTAGHNAVALVKNIGKVYELNQKVNAANSPASKMYRQGMKDVKKLGGSLQPSGIGNDRGGIMGEFARWQDEWQKKQKKK